MHALLIKKKAMHLKETGEEHVKGFRGRKGKMETL